MSLLDKVLNVTSTIIKVPSNQLSEESSMGNPNNWDSVAHVQLIVQLEKVFDVSFEFDELEHLVSIKTIVQSLKNKGIDAK